MRKITKQSPVTLVELPPTQFGIYNGDAGYDVYTKFRTPPRALPYLHAVLLADGWQNVQQMSPVYHGNNGRLTPENERRIFGSEVLGVSAITRTSPQSIELIKRYKQNNPQGIVIAGGFDPTFRKEDWLNSGTDIVVIGEGERTFSELMKRLSKDSYQLEDIRGIAFKRENEIRTAERRALLTSDELGELPHPFYDSQLKSGVRIITAETTRGCPNRCDFCSVTEFYGGKFRTKPLAYILDQLNDVKNIGKDLFFTDDNLVGNPKRAVQLLEEIASHNLNTRLQSAQCTIRAAESQELIDALKKANIRGLYIGIESINDAALGGSLAKPYTAKQNRENIRRLREEGFWVHGMMIVGSDEDDSEVLSETSEWVNKNLDSLQLFPPTPLPGTPLWNKIQTEDRILTKDFSLYDCQNVVFRPKNFTPFELQTKIYEMYKSFYSPLNVAKRLPKCPMKLLSLGIFSYLYLFGGKNGVLYSPQSLKHLDFLKSVS